MKTKKLNLCEILKNCPMGTKLYSPFLGYVSFVEVDEDFKEVVVSNMNDDEEYFSSDGKYIDNPDAEVSLFPSKENHDWSTWSKNNRFDPKVLNQFDKVLVCCDGVWHSAFFDFMSKGGLKYVIGRGSAHLYIIPYNDNTKHLLGTRDEAPKYYRYWED